MPRLIHRTIMTYCSLIIVYMNMEAWNTIQTYH